MSLNLKRIRENFIFTLFEELYQNLDQNPVISILRSSPDFGTELYRLDSHILSLDLKHKNDDVIDSHRDKSHRHSEPCPFLTGDTQFARRNDVRDISWNQHATGN